MTSVSLLLGVAEPPVFGDYRQERGGLAVTGIGSK